MYKCIWTIATVLCSLAPAWAQSVVIGVRAAGGTISFQPAEELLINQSKKIRLLPEQTSSLDENTVKRLPKTDLAAAGLIRDDGKGRLVRVSGPDGVREIVLPENLSLKTSVPVSQIPGKLSLTVVKSKKAKQFEDLPAEMFWCYLSGPSPESSALQLLYQDWAFLDRAEQLAAMEGFVASFPSSNEVKEFRNNLEVKLSDALAKFEGGGFDKDLRALQPLAVMAKRAFVSNAPIQDLHRRIFERIGFVDTRIRFLKSLAVLGEWDRVLELYPDFEPYQGSFPEMIALRREALEESAWAHSRRGQALALRGNSAAAMVQSKDALARDRENPEISRDFDAYRLEASKVEAERNALKRKVLKPGSAEAERFRRALDFAMNAIRDKDFQKAEEQIRNARKENEGAPEIVLTEARLLAAREQLSAALSRLDDYDVLVVDQSERDKGSSARNEILYDLNKRKVAAKHEVEAMKKSGEYSKLSVSVKSYLDLDPNDPDFQYFGGATAAVLRDQTTAKRLLKSYLDVSNSIGGNPEFRDKARQLLAIVSAPAAPVSTDGTPIWYSGRNLANGLYYCPETLGFRLPIESVAGNKVRLTFNWERSRLNSIQVVSEDEKGSRNYRLLSVPGVNEAEVGAVRTEDPTFYFSYSTNPAQVRSVKLKRSSPSDASAPLVRIRNDGKGQVFLADEDGEPMVLLPDNHLVDIAALGLLEGAAATVVAGNSFFNPFLWDGIHYFSASYDNDGRISSASEWNAGSIVRFTWEGERLMEIRAYKRGSVSPYYRRKISYTSGVIASEEFSVNSRAGRIKYEYQQGTLKQIKIENDGKEWIAKVRQ